LHEFAHLVNVEQCQAPDNRIRVDQANALQPSSCYRLHQPSIKHYLARKLILTNPPTEGTERCVDLSGTKSHIFFKFRKREFIFALLILSSVLTVYM